MNNTEIMNSLKDIKEFMENIKAERMPTQLYTNKTLQEYLGVNGQTLKLYRDRGILGFSREGDKYWYTQEDVEQFLQHNKHNAYIIS